MFDACQRSERSSGHLQSTRCSPQCVINLGILISRGDPIWMRQWIHISWCPVKDASTIHRYMKVDSQSWWFAEESRSSDMCRSESLKPLAAFAAAAAADAAVNCTMHIFLHQQWHYTHERRQSLLALSTQASNGEDHCTSYDCSVMQHCSWHTRAWMFTIVDMTVSLATSQHLSMADFGFVDHAGE